MTPGKRRGTLISIHCPSFARLRGVTFTTVKSERLDALSLNWRPLVWMPNLAIPARLTGFAGASIRPQPDRHYKHSISQANEA